MEIEEQTEQPEDSIRSDLEKAFEESEPKTDSAPEITESKESTKETKSRDQSGKFAKADAKLSKETKTETPEEKIPDAPRSWAVAEKAKWNEATPEVRQAILRREQEVEQGFTKLDEDRNFGKSLKEIISPYMPIIQAEGGTPQAAVQSLLNTAYILRTAPVAQKTALFHQLAQQYGVDLKTNTAAVHPDQTVQQLQAQIATLQQEIQKQPQVFAQQQENRVVKDQIDAFAADPKNVHYEKLKPVMASLLTSGQAKDLQDAYEKASWADPDIRSSILVEQHKAAEEKRIAEIKAKADSARKTAVSVRGSPSINPVANGKDSNSIREDLEAAFELHS